MICAAGRFSGRTGHILGRQLDQGDSFMAIQPTQPQGIGGVLDTTFLLYKSSLGALWPVCLLMSVVASPPSIYMMMNGGAAVTPAGAGQMLAAMSNPVYWLIYIASIVAMMWVIGALYLKQYAIGTDQEMSIGSALQASVGRIVPLFLMVILYSIAMIVGFVLLIVPGVILLVSLILATGLVMFEGKGPVDSLTGSHKLVWGNWWRTFVILSIGGILVLVIYFALGLVVALMIPFIGLTDVLMYTLVSTLLVGVVMNVLVTPFFSAMLIALYWDLKLRKEGGDLAARVGALNAA
jgi:hypothetical protein